MLLYSFARVFYTVFLIIVDRQHGSCVFAVQDGEVLMAEHFGGYGKSIRISHGEKVYSFYARMDELLVEVGDLVKKGQTIGRAKDSPSAMGAPGTFLHSITYKGLPINGVKITPTGSLDTRPSPIKSPKKTFAEQQLPLDAKIAVFPDTNLETIVRIAINKPTGEITNGDLADLTELKAVGYGIRKLNGLEYAVNLKAIFLGYNQISDINALSGLTKLTKIDLRRNQISDISTLSGLTKLTEINEEKRPVSILIITRFRKILKIW